MRYLCRKKKESDRDGQPHLNLTVLMFCLSSLAWFDAEQVRSKLLAKNVNVSDWFVCVISHSTRSPLHFYQEPKHKYINMPPRPCNILNIKTMISEYSIFKTSTKAERKYPSRKIA